MSRDFTLRPRGASHSFRQRVDLHIGQRERDQDYDLKLFVLSFTAFFICIYTFII